MEALNALQTQKMNLFGQKVIILTNILEPVIPHTCWELSKELFNLKTLMKN